MERYFQEKRNTEFQEREIRRFKKQAVLLQKLKERYDKRLQKFEPFRGYMAQLKASSQDRFPDLYDAITKYEKLVEERREREERNDEADEYLERKDEWQAREANVCIAVLERFCIFLKIQFTFNGCSGKPLKSLPTETSSLISPSIA